jgi:hypothetical protein
MSHPDPGSAREEAERLVAAALAMAGRFATNTDPRSGHDGPKMATGSAECCVCPICRTIAAMRDPDPDFTERLATGAGDLAAGVASLLRSFGAPAGRRPWQTPEQSPPPAQETAGPSPESTAPEGAAPEGAAPESAAPKGAAPASPESAAPESVGPTGSAGDTDGDPADVWRAATRTGDDVDRPADADVWSAATTRPTKPMARKAVKKAAPRTPPPDDDD